MKKGEIAEFTFALILGTILVSGELPFKSSLNRLYEVVIYSQSCAGLPENVKQEFEYEGLKCAVDYFPTVAYVVARSQHIISGYDIRFKNPTPMFTVTRSVDYFPASETDYYFNLYITESLVTRAYLDFMAYVKDDNLFLIEAVIVGHSPVVEEVFYEESIFKGTNLIPGKTINTTNGLSFIPIRPSKRLIENELDKRMVSNLHVRGWTSSLEEYQKPF